jgi:hypothetical protein
MHHNQLRHERERIRRQIELRQHLERLFRAVQPAVIPLTTERTTSDGEVVSGSQHPVLLGSSSTTTQSEQPTTEDAPGYRVRLISRV